MSKITDIQKLINERIEDGCEYITEIYDQIGKLGYPRPMIRQAKSKLLADVNKKIDILTNTLRLRSQ